MDPGFFCLIIRSTKSGLPRYTPEDLFAKFSHIKSENKIEATIKEMSLPLDMEKDKLPGETFIVTAQGENRKGMVKIMGDFFFDRNINIFDLVTTRERKTFRIIRAKTYTNSSEVNR